MKVLIASHDFITAKMVADELQIPRGKWMYVRERSDFIGRRGNVLILTGLLYLRPGIYDFVNSNRVVEQSFRVIEISSEVLARWTER